jgi:hypothetical protein
MVLRMGRQTTIYIRDRDLKLWARAEAFAVRRRMPVSGLVMAALETYLAEHDRDPRPGA